MYHDFLTNKWVLGGVGFLIVLSFACVLWYQHDTADERKAAAETKELLRQMEIVKKTSDANREAEQVNREAEQAADAPAESITQITDKSETNTIFTELRDVASAQSQPPTDASGDNIEFAEVGVSPHGFGHYPEIPVGAPIAQFDNSHDVDMELMLRVAVKAWNEGERFESGFYNAARGKVYLNYPHIAYVEYSNKIDEATNEVIGKRITDVSTSAANKGVGASILEGNIPPGITIVDIDESGIDPYEYLDLP